MRRAGYPVLARVPFRLPFFETLNKKKAEEIPRPECSLWQSEDAAPAELQHVVLLAEDAMVLLEATDADASSIEV